LLVPNSIRAVYVHYPDPHLRSRGQHKIFNADFLDAIHGALQPAGRLHVVTDHEELFFEEMLPLVEDATRWQKTHQERYLVGYDPPVKSRYQKLWEKHEVPPLRFEVRKVR
jgi:tRNA (guanine-N7-)-methyltransferase